MIRSPSKPAALRQLAEVLAKLETSRERAWSALRDVVSSMPDDDETEHDEHWRSEYDQWKTRDGDDPGRLGRSEPLRFHCLQCSWRGVGVFAQAKHFLETRHRTRAWSRGEKETKGEE